MKSDGFLIDLFSSIDDKNIQTFLTFISDDCLFRFGNIPSISGKENVGDFVSNFLDSINSLEHEIEDTWEIDCGIICHGIVSYTRHNKSVLSIPFSNILNLDNGLINEYLIFADTSDL